MKWITKTEIEPSEWKVSQTDKVWTIGSCFAQNIGLRMEQRGFCVRSNPLGTLFNPHSIAMALQQVISCRQYSPQEMVECQDAWHCMDFSSNFSRTTPAEASEAVNHRIAELHHELPQLRTLIVTFGSTHVFNYKPTGKIVGNCHKIPAREFEESDMEVSEIVDQWRNLISRLREIAPGLRLIFTVSPVRHKAYGLHADRLSKSRLLLATHQLCNKADIAYFPAYEILTDELRDYRFYADDLVHPSELASDYIFERWAEAFCAETSRASFSEELKKWKRSKHNPLISHQQVID